MGTDAFCKVGSERRILGPREVCTGAYDTERRERKSRMLEFSNLMQVVEIRVMKGIFGAPRRLALGGVALVYPDRWWR